MILTPIIHLKEIDSSPAIESRINERVAKLDRFFNRITRCRVTVDQTQRRHHQGKLFNVKIDVTVPGAELVVTRVEHEDIYVAIRDAFNALERKIEDYARVLRGEVKSHVTAPEGRVIRLFRAEGYGFIAASDGREVYFHRNSLIDLDFDLLSEGTEVLFLEEEGAEGPQAVRVSASRYNLPA